MKRLTKTQQKPANAPQELSKRELKKFGVTLTDSVPAFGGALQRSVWPKLTCDKCGESWPLPALSGARKLKADIWVCPQGCNKPTETDAPFCA